VKRVLAFKFDSCSLVGGNMLPDTNAAVFGSKKDMAARACETTVPLWARNHSSIELKAWGKTVILLMNLVI